MPALPDQAEEPKPTGPETADVGPETAQPHAVQAPAVQASAGEPVADPPAGPAENEEPRVANGADGDADEPGGGQGMSFFGMVREILIVLVIALTLSLIIKTFLIQAFFIPSESMENTLLVGDRVLVSKLTPTPLDLRRGDIVVFKDPGEWLPPPIEPDDGRLRHNMRRILTFVGLLPSDSGEHLIKRVIGLPGDKVECCDAEGRVSVNGKPLDEKGYLFPGDVPSGTPFTVTVPKGRIWVMGDHRSNSQDSRSHRDMNDGTVPMDNIVGEAFVIIWPSDRFDRLSNPEGVFDGVPAP